MGLIKETGMSSVRRAVIQRHLRDSGCNPDVIGYNILLEVISMAADHPFLNRRELFDLYAKSTDYGEAWWVNAYNAARYCYVTADSPTCRGVYRYIKKVAMAVLQEEDSAKGAAALEGDKNA